MYKPITDIAIYAPLLAANGNKQVYTEGATLVGLTDANGDPVLDGNGAQLTQWMYPVTDKCERSAVVMGDDYVRLSFDLATRVQFAAFSFIEYNGQTFFLRETYRPKNNGTYRDSSGVMSSHYTYDMRFVSLGNMLTKHTCLRNVVVVNETWNEPEININGTLDTLYTMIIGSIEQAALRIRNERQYYRQCLLSLVANKANARLTPNTDLVTFSFSGAKIADCLTTIANGYDETEWFITEDNGSFTLNIAKHEDGENVAILHLSDEKYENTGADKDVHPTLSGGLTSCEYAQEWNGIVQRITPFGSDRNMVKQTGVDSNTDMMVSYGKRLRLDPNHKVRWQSGMTYEAWVQASTSGATFGSLYPTTAMKRRGVTGCYVVKDKQGNAVLLEVDKDGAVTNPDTNVDTGIEEVVMYDEVYPQCHFKITSVEEKTKRIDGELQPRYTIEGVAVDENKYPKSVLANLGMFPIRIIEAETLSVVFESGLLNGREFEITNKTTKDEGVTEYSLRFSIVADGDITEGTLIPSGNFKPNVNDQFALFNMKMPDEFIDMARDELAQKAYDDLIELENTRPEVKCVADEDIFEQYDIYLGRRCEVTSEIFVSDAHFISRVISYSYPLSAPSRVSFSLASAIMEGTISSIESSIGEQTGQIGGLNQRTVNLSRRGWHDASEMAEMLDGITTPMMLVGVEKNQFQYTSSVQCVNGRMNGGVEHFDHLTIGNGVLQHTQKDWIDWHDGRWYIEPVDDLHLCNDSGDSINSVANQEKPFYLYAFCQEDSEYAQMKLYDMDYTSEHHIEEDVHYLLLGILSSEFVDGGTAYRVFNRTNGYTQIAGGTITTEVLQDPTSNLIIDMAHKPPRIIAKGGAEIIGNIRFKSFTDESGNNPLETIVNSISVGGRNLLRDTAYTKTADKVKGHSYYNASSGASGKSINGCSMATSNGMLMLAIRNSNIRFMLTQTGALGWNKKDDTYTLSFEGYANTACKVAFGAGYSDASQYVTADMPVGAANIAQIKLTQTVPHAPANYGIFFLRFTDTSGNVLSNVDVTITKVKLEKGAIASSWSVAPEDTAEEIVDTQNYINNIQKDLQDQIDGVVDSYFLEGEPTMDDTKKPLSDWKTEGGGTIDYAKHEGDTYTNIQNYNGLEVGKWEQGGIYTGSTYLHKSFEQCKYKSSIAIRFGELITYKSGDILRIGYGSNDYRIYITYFDADGNYATAGGNYIVSQATERLVTLNASYTKFAIQIRSISSTDIATDIVPPLSLCINPTAGHSWRFCNKEDADETTWHWHEIADSDAVLALQKAAEAQDTADGKRRVFSTSAGQLPTPPYDKGDLWANATFIVDNSSDPPKYTDALLKCIEACPAGQPPKISHWADASRAIDAADAAQASADDALTKAANIVDDGIISGGTEKGTLKKEWIEIAGQNMQGTQNGSYYKAKTEAAKYGLSYNTMSTAFDNLKAAMTAILAEPDKDFVLLTQGGTTYKTKDDFIKLWRTYYDEEIAVLNNVSAVTNGTRNYFAMRFMLEWNNTYDGIAKLGITAGQEYIGVHEGNLYSKIGGSQSYNDILQGKVSFAAGKQYALKVRWRVPSAQSYDGLYLGFKYSDGSRSSWISCGKAQTSYITASLISAAGKTVTGICCTYGTYCYTQISNISLTEGARVPDDWIDADEDIVYGGENLYTGVDPLDIAAANNAYNYRQLKLASALKNGTKYVVSFGSISLTNSAKQCAILLYSFASGSLPSISSKRYLLQASQSRQSCVFTIPDDGRTYVVLVYAGVNGSTQNIAATYSQIMVQEGTKATSYQASYKFLAEAFEHDATQQTTDINGGLLATSLIKLRNANGQVTAGMSGLDDHKKAKSGSTLIENANSEGVTLWGGGDYAAALAAAAGNGDIAVLLTKTGLKSRIGCFRVVDKDTVMVVTDNNNIIITNDSISNKAVIEQTKNGYINGNVSASGGQSPSGSYQYIGTPVTFNVKGGKYHIDIPFTEFEAEVKAVSSDDPQGEGIYVEAGVSSYHAQIVIENNGVRKYTSGSVDFSDIEVSTDNGGGTTVRDSESDTISAVSVDLELEAGTVKIGVYGSYRLKTIFDGYSSGNSTASVSGGTTVTMTQIGKYVVLAKDGIGIIANSNATFYVKTDSASALQVIAKGLPTSEPSEEGQLWQRTITYKNAAGQNASAKVICIK